MSSKPVQWTEPYRTTIRRNWGTLVAEKGLRSMLIRPYAVAISLSAVIVAALYLIVPDFAVPWAQLVKGLALVMVAIPLMYLLCAFTPECVRVNRHVVAGVPRAWVRAASIRTDQHKLGWLVVEYQTKRGESRTRERAIAASVDLSALDQALAKRA